ncbi:MAG: TolC family protein [Nitrospirota bacterium]
MKQVFLILCIFLLSHSHTSFAESKKTIFTLSDVIEFALQNNPDIMTSISDIRSETFGVKAALSEKMPKFDFNTGLTRSRYPSPVTPISGSPLEGAGFPEFDETIYDFGVSLTLPLYRGG